MDATRIEWADSTFNPWEGCTKISPGCDHCYAEAARDHRLKRVAWGPGMPRRRTGDANWHKPLQWNNRPFFQCTGCGWRGDVLDGASCPNCLSMQVIDARRRVFCASLADWLDNEVPHEWLADLLDLIFCTPKLDWLLLTKRIGNWRQRMIRAAALLPVPVRGWAYEWLAGNAPKNVWMLATVVNQAEFDRDVPKLIEVPARVRGVSIEPMLGPIDMMAVDYLTAKHGSYPFKGIPDEHHTKLLHMLDWVICGGESGPGARPMHPDWARSLRGQCSAAGVAFLFKQWGELRPVPAGSIASKRAGFIARDGRMLTDVAPSETQHSIETLAPYLNDRSYGWAWMEHAGKKAAGRLLDGIEHNGFPKG